jgi:hypothetical protein
MDFSNDDFADTKPFNSEHALDEDYRQLVLSQLIRLGIPLHVVDVDVLLAGQTPDGREIFVAMLKIVAWEREAGVRLLLAQGFLEAGVRRALEASWLPEVSEFGGIWMRISTRLQSGPSARDLRSVVQVVNEMTSSWQSLIPQSGAASSRLS